MMTAGERVPKMTIKGTIHWAISGGIRFSCPQFTPCPSPGPGEAATPTALMTRLRGWARPLKHPDEGERKKIRIMYFIVLYSAPLTPYFLRFLTLN